MDSYLFLQPPQPSLHLTAAQECGLLHLGVQTGKMLVYIGCLDQKQADSLVSIFKAMGQKRQAMMDSVEDRDARRDKMMSLMAQTDEMIEAMLTKDQKVKYDEMKKERMRRFQQRGQ